MPKEEEFTMLIREHQGLIFKVSALYTNQKQDQGDLYQEIVYQLWKSFDSFRGQSKISTWMYRVALNTAIAHLNKKNKRKKEVSVEKIPQVLEDGSSEVMQERLKQLHREIQNLNVLEKGIILLLLEGNTYEEISEITGLTKTNVGTRISRIKEKLRSRMVNK